MRSFLAVRALWFAIVAPWRLKESTTGAAAATFAVAVLLGAFVVSGVQMWEHADPRLAEEAKQFAIVTGTANKTDAPQTDAPRTDARQTDARQTETPEDDVVPIDSPGRQFTALLGNNLFVFVLGIVLSAGAYMLIARFLTNETYTYSMAVVCVSAATSISILGTLVASAIHLATHSMRFGLHAGVALDPLTSPFLYLWLQRIDVFDMWRALAIGVGLTTWVGLDRRYGYVVGAVVWLTTFLVFFGIGSVISWILAQKLAQ